ncbi:MAG: hypothetical protein ACRDJH_05410 [Thermomicrobiales bacterium]
MDQHRDRIGHPDTPDHIAGCTVCREAAMVAMDVDLGRVWVGIAGDVWAKPAGAVERWVARVLRSPGLARALMTTPSLIVSWIFASIAVFGAGVLVTWTTGDPWVALLAPAVAGAGIAFAYGPGIDPAFELSRSMAISDRMVLLVRALTVFGLNAVLGLIASLFAEGAADLTFSWLVPMTTVAALALAAATLSHSPNVGVAAGVAGWCIVILAGQAGTGELAAALERNLLPAYVLATVVLVGVALYATAGERSGSRTWSAG